MTDSEHIARFEGEVRASLATLNTRVAHVEHTCGNCRNNIDNKFEGVHRRIEILSQQVSDLRVRVAVLSAGAAAGGALLGSLFQWVIGRIA